jgi:hypothetical protein
LDFLILTFFNLFLNNTTTLLFTDPTFLAAPHALARQPCHAGPWAPLAVLPHVARQLCFAAPLHVA